MKTTELGKNLLVTGVVILVVFYFLAKSKKA